MKKWLGGVRFQPSLLTNRLKIYNITNRCKLYLNYPRYPPKLKLLNKLSFFLQSSTPLHYRQLWWILKLMWMSIKPLPPPVPQSQLPLPPPTLLSTLEEVNRSQIYNNNDLLYLFKYWPSPSTSHHHHRSRSVFCDIVWFTFCYSFNLLLLILRRGKNFGG